MVTVKGTVYVVVLLFVARFATAEPTTWRKEDGGNDHAYEVLTSDTGITWTAANEAAESRGGYLATVTSAEENKFIVNLLRDTRFWNQASAMPYRYFGPWIGGVQKEGAVEPNGDWSWVTGEEFKWLGGGFGYPDNYWARRRKNENRISYFHRSDEELTAENARWFSPVWNDATEDAFGGKVTAYVVEWNEPPRK